MTWAHAEDGVEITRELLEQYIAVGLGTLADWVRMPEELRSALYAVATERQLDRDVSLIVAVAHVLGGEEARVRALDFYATVDGGKARRMHDLAARAQRTAATLGRGEVVL
jgi:hypothetical protein